MSNQQVYIHLLTLAGMLLKRQLTADEVMLVKVYYEQRWPRQKDAWGHKQPIQ